MISNTVENYLKAIYKISERESGPASTSAISQELETSAASVTDMLKRLSEKSLINYKKYKGVTLTREGRQLATTLIRKHRLWEVFLVDKLNFTWDEVHEIAEQLEHIDSDALIDRLDAFLSYPKFDPHGDPIPSRDGKITLRRQTLLSNMTPGQKGTVVGVQEHSSSFLQHLDKIGIILGTTLEVKSINEFDRSLQVIIEDRSVTLSDKVSKNIFLRIE